MLLGAGVGRLAIIWATLIVGDGVVGSIVGRNVGVLVGVPVVGAEVGLDVGVLVLRGHCPPSGRGMHSASSQQPPALLHRFLPCLVAQLELA